VQHIDLGRIEVVRRVCRLVSLQFSKGQRRQASDAAGNEAWTSTTLVHLRRLYDLLIRPAERYLTNGHCVIVPHGDLHGIPFHALHDGDGYLIDRESMSYAPSAGILALCSARPPVNNEQALVIGVPDSNAPFIREECEAVARILPNVKRFVGTDATAECFLVETVKSRFIHLATHAYFRADNPLFSSLRLSDSRFCVLDLYQLCLDAELTTLSGCSTGLHGVLGGDEILGLTRGLLLAGSRGVQMSLWDVNDASTFEYMRMFYRRLMSGSPVCEAMRKSMLELRELCPHPYYWAPFAYVGGIPNFPIFSSVSNNPLEMNSRANPL
jgi:CHAT domain-containing protein